MILGLGDAIEWGAWAVILGGVAFICIGSLIGGAALTGEKGSLTAGCLFALLLYATPAVAGAVTIALVVLAGVQLLRDCAS